MSRGPGRVMRGVLVAVAEAPDRSDGTGPEPITVAELGKSIYETSEPTRAQRVAVARACRRLVAQGNAWAWTVHREVHCAQRTPSVRRLGDLARGTVDRPMAAITRPLTDEQERELARRRQEWLDQLAAA